MKNKIHKCDFLIVGAGLIGSIAALALYKNNFKVMIIDKEKKIIPDKRTLAVNANSREFLIGLGIWDKLKSKPQSIEKIIISDYINHKPLIFENNSETMGDVIFNYEMVQIVRAKLKKLNILKTDININFNNIQPNKITVIDKNSYKFKKIIISIGKNNNLNPSHRSIKFDQGHNSFVGFLIITKITGILLTRYLIPMDHSLFYPHHLIIKISLLSFIPQRKKFPRVK